MNEKLIRETGTGQRAEILGVLKRHGGMSIKELAAHFRMSYMGLKAPCLALEKEGFLDTFRRPVALGRPELIYRLTRRSHELFPSANNRFTGEILQAIQQTYGPAAPAKLLFSLFAQHAKTYRAELAGSSLVEKAASLARLRDADGYMAEFDPAGGGSPVARGGNGASATKSGMQIVEHASPIEDLLRAYPILARLERELYEGVLGCAVQREEDGGRPGLYRCVFRFSGG